MKSIKCFLINLLFFAFLQNFFLACNSTEPKYNKLDLTIQNWGLYDINNFGNSNNQITALVIDNQNVLWVGSWNGLAKNDGNNWIQYDTNNSGLSNNYVTCITIDNRNNLWIGTSDGLTKFDGRSWIVYNTNNSPLPIKNIRALAVDKNNTLWIGCGDFTLGGLISFSNNKWDIYTKYNSTLPSSIINVIHIDKNDNKWIGTDNGLVKIDNHNNWNVYTKNNSGLLFSVNTLSTDSHNNVWIGSIELERLDYNYYYGGLQKFDGENWFDFRPHQNGNYNSNAIVSNRVSNIACDRNDYLIIATQTEWKYPYNLSFFKNDKWINLLDIADGFPFNPFIHDIEIDKNNTVWLATQFGVVYFNYSYQ